MQVVETRPSLEEIWQALEEVPDPEIPVVSLVEMGIVRSVDRAGDELVVTITPTFSGCPALEAMKEEIIERLSSLGVSRVSVEISLSPPWTTDWIAPSARSKLREFGIGPPIRHGGDIELLFSGVIPCPYCESANTEMRSAFGPTPCRSLAYCRDCREPFEQMKPL